MRDRAALREEADAKKKKEPAARKAFTLQARQTATNLQLSPDSKWVIATVIDAGNAKNNIVPSWITDSGYIEDIPARSNVGDSQSRIRLAIIDAQTGEVKWADHGLKAGTSERAIQLGQPIWNEEGTRAVVVGRAADFKDRWIFALDPATAKLRVLEDTHDNAWVGGPGANTVGWMKNDREVYFQSEKTGYSQLYAVSFEGGEPRALTSGNWEVLNTRQSRDRSRFFLTASKDSPYENHLYVMDGEGGPLTRLTAAPGKHATTMSPDEQWFADIYSYTNKPPDLYVQEARPQAEPKRLTTSPAPEFSQYPWLDVPIVQFTARDGVKVPARLFKPANFKRGGPGDRIRARVRLLTECR